MLKKITFIFLLSPFFLNVFSQVPQRIKNICDSLIIEKTGIDFFTNKVTFNCKESYGCFDSTALTKRELKRWKKYKNTKLDKQEHYILVYKINPIDTFTSTCSITTDSKGEILHSYEIPDCKNYPEDCNILISRNQAIEIAKRLNLEQGLNPWEITLHWVAYDPARIQNIKEGVNFTTGKFCWVIKNTTFISGCNSEGIKLYIEVQTGKKYHMYDVVWKIHCVY